MIFVCIIWGQHGFCFPYHPQNRAQIYDFFLINEDSINISYFCRLKMSIIRRMNRVRHTIYIIYMLFFVVAGNVCAQNRQADSLVLSGDSLHRQYRFEEAEALFNEAMNLLGNTPQDSILAEMIETRKLLCENGRSMSSYVYTPKVVARQKFSIEDFFLHYPMEDKAWRKTPNQLDSVSDGLSHAIYAPEGAETLYFSANDENGARNLYVTHKKDSLWTWPSMLNEYLTSVSDEVYPVLSSDGKSMYFSSRGLYGVGGFDIYVSEWDEDASDWSEPRNMGFPYSSPYDDFLYLDAPEEGYSFFASNRECSRDSIWVYVLEFDNIPVRHSIDDPQELIEICRLEPESEKKKEEPVVNEEVPENMDRYMSKMSQVRALRDSIAFYTSSLEEERNLFALSNDDTERIRLTGLIRSREARLPQLQDSYRKEMAELQEIEMEFLFSGVVFDPDKIMEDASAGQDDVQEYEFVSNSFGNDLELDMIKPKKGFDYSFMVLEKGRFAEDNTIPDGLVYQIQIFSAGGKAGVRNLRGLSPVFEIRSSSGRYAYRVGLFRSYKDVLSKLNRVKNLGFRSAFIVAYDDGKEISVATARNMEASGGKEKDLYEVRITPSDGELDDSLTAGIRQQADGKDIARVEKEDGTIVFVVGPFADKKKAENLVSFVKAMGLADIDIKEIIK